MNQSPVVKQDTFTVSTSKVTEDTWTTTDQGGVSINVGTGFEAPVIV
jgi:hypothetical protein